MTSPHRSPRTSPIRRVGLQLARFTQAIEHAVAEGRPIPPDMLRYIQTEADGLAQMAARLSAAAQRGQGVPAKYTTQIVKRVRKALGYTYP